MKYSLLFILTIMVGCANKVAYDNGGLIKSFTEYKLFYKTKTESIYFNPILWDSITKARINSNKSAFAGALEKFPNEIIKITDYKESTNNKTGCLLVSGINSENISLDYYLTYRLKKNKWIIKDITVKYFFDGTKRFLKEAVCNEQKRAELWLQFMEQKE